MTMRDNMAKAMFNQYNMRWGMRGKWNNQGRDFWLGIADVALEILLEPTAKMLQEGFLQTGCTHTTTVFPAIIRAAKAGK